MKNVKGTMILQTPTDKLLTISDIDEQVIDHVLENKAFPTFIFMSKEQYNHYVYLHMDKGYFPSQHKGIPISVEGVSFPRHEGRMYL